MINAERYTKTRSRPNESLKESGQVQPDFVCTASTIIAFASVLLNFLLSGLAPAIAGLFTTVTAASVMVCLLFGAAFSFNRLKALIIVISVLVAVLLVQGIPNESTGIAAFQRYVWSILAIFMFVQLPVANIQKTIQVFAHMALLGSAVLAASTGTIVYAGSLRLAPIWEGIHSTALITASLTVIIIGANTRRVVKLPMVILSFFLLIGYGVSTAYVMAGLFLLGYVFDKLSISKWILSVFSATGLGALVVYRDRSSLATSADLGIEALGSGRLGSWIERLEWFSVRNLWDQLFGTGPYSDYAITKIWWWEAKNAHSDLITLLMEFGLVGLGLALFLGLLAYQKGAGLVKLLILVILLGSAISNSLLDRPIIATAWGVALLFVAQVPSRSVQKTGEI